MADDKLTHKSQEALSVAIRRAAADGSPQVEALHLLVALVEQADGTTAPLLRAVGADPALIAKQAEERLARQPKASGATLSAPGTSRALNTAIATARLPRASGAAGRPVAAGRWRVPACRSGGWVVDLRSF